MNEALSSLEAGRDLTRDQACALFAQIMTGAVPVDPLCALLAALAHKGETIDEIAGAAEIMRRHVVAVRAPDGSIDTCGTGGDGINTFNVSTTAALIAAGAGAIVAKHGNRTSTRVSGSAEVMSELGVNIDADVPTLERCLREAGLCFMFAPHLHPAMRHAMPARRKLGTRTIFNLLGPLTNPAGVKRQVLGVAAPELCATLATVSRELGGEHILVVHGAGGLCDLSVTGPSYVCELKEGKLRAYEITPEEVGLSGAPVGALLVDSPAASAEAVREILAGAAGTRRDQAVLNAAAALVVAGLAENLRDGVHVAQQAIDSGAAAEKLRRLAAVSSGKDSAGAAR